MGVIDGKKICQIALVVKDIEKTANEYAKLFGVDVPEIFQIPPVEEAHTRFRGELTKTRAKLAVFDLGQVVLELTEPDNEPSSWKEYLETHGEGVHHIAFMTDDREQEVEYFAHKDIPIRHYGEYEGGNYTVFDTKDQFGLYLQVKANT